jgi:hypothetical protein
MLTKREKAKVIRCNRLPCRSIAVTMILCWFVNTVLYAQHPEVGFTSMFNGQDLSGWEGQGKFWKVQDGAIVGETKEASQQTIFLYWKGGEPADFEMRCQLRISGREANSGIQIRSQRRPNWDTYGYQADFDESGYCVGNLYIFGREPLATFAQRGDSVIIDSLGKRSVNNFADPARLLDAYKRGGWNDYRIVARGRQVTVYLNGVLMSKVEDYEQKYFLPKGIIALQLHSGAPMRVEFKDLRIRQY